MINGLILVTLLAIFFAFNDLVPVSELVRLAPQALANVGLVVLIAVSYVPETMRHLERIREAQALRGRDLSGLRDWQPLLIPLLIGGLERSMNLAETMVARGYGASADARLALTPQLGLLASLALALTGWLLTFWNPLLGGSMLALGILAMLLVYWRMGRRMPRTTYESDRGEPVTGWWPAVARFSALLFPAAAVCGPRYAKLYALPDADPAII